MTGESHSGVYPDLGPAWQAVEMNGTARRLNEVKVFLKRFVHFGSEFQAVAVALWVAHVYAISVAPAAAYLRIKSAAEESGKTTLLEVLELLLGDLGVNAVSVTPAAVFRLREKVGPVAFLLDEIDNTLRNRSDEGAKDLLAIVNAGYRPSATVLRSSPPSFEPKRFRAFGPAAIAGIGHLHPTTESRCIPILLDRKLRGTGERWLMHLVREEGEEIASRLRQWATEDTLNRLRIARPPDIPEDLRDRHVEAWWMLWNIADEAGGEWPKAARDAAVALHLGADQTDTMTLGVLLLAHIRQAFDEDGADRLKTATLLDRLVKNEEGPWGKWWGTRLEQDGGLHGPASDLARHLRAFGAKLRPRVIRMPDGTTPRGYLREDFDEVWSRYLPPRNDRNDRNGPASDVAGVASVAPPQEETSEFTLVGGVDE